MGHVGELGSNGAFRLDKLGLTKSSIFPARNFRRFINVKGNLCRFGAGGLFVVRQRADRFSEAVCRIDYAQT